MGRDPEATYAALCQEYAPRNPFREFGHGDITLNQLRVLIRHLPHHSARHRSEPASQGWTVTDHLLAKVIDAITYGTAVAVAVGNQVEGEIERPEPFETPEIAVQRSERDDEDRRGEQDARAWFEQMTAQLN